MPHFRVKMTRIVAETFQTTIDADDEVSATELAEAAFPNPTWTLLDDQTLSDSFLVDITEDPS